MKSFLLIFALASSFSIIAQTATVSGTVTDNGAKEAVVGAKVIFSPKFRAITDFEGDYEIKDVPFGEYNLVITMLSFDTLYLTVKVDEANFTNDIILGGSQEIDAVSVIGNFAQDRNSCCCYHNRDKRNWRGIGVARFANDSKFKTRCTCYATGWRRW